MYIIPRSVIFRCFYGPNSAIANAFCKGPWQEASHEVIYYWPLESGLETRLNHEEKTWDIILQPKIDSQYAPLLAAQIFDPYAKSCAESIYTNIIRERGAKNNEPWFAAAKIPFDTSQESLRLRIKGFYLKTLGKGPRKFLVTGITEADFPRYFPKIRWEKANSGEQGANITPVDEPAPYQNGTRIRPAPAGIVGFSDEDFAVEEGALLVPADDFAWAQAPTMEKLVKQSSKQYNAPEAHRFFQPTLENVSSGSATHRKSGLAEAQVETAIRRDRSQQFMNLLESFDALQASDVIERWSIFGPTDRAMLASRHGLPCWNFLDEDARVTGKWPRRSWRLLDPAPKDKDGAIGVPRCALVIQISMENITGFWIEIEVRPNGAEGFLSPFVVTQENPMK
ncbi:MAG: hypothetical protein IPK63_14145 [Candidatus Competibacteraceae bacterium]|nr:hypothetical protein [Candidatus Competibacteraceae bacterium]